MLLVPSVSRKRHSWRAVVRDQEAVGSNPVARTINEVSALADASFLFYAMKTHGLVSPKIWIPCKNATHGWHFYSEYKYVLFQFQKSVFCRRPIEAALNTGFCPSLR